MARRIKLPVGRQAGARRSGQGAPGGEGCFARREPVAKPIKLDKEQP